MSRTQPFNSRGRSLPLAVSFSNVLSLVAFVFLLLPFQAHAGDDDCVVRFSVGKVDTNGQYTMIEEYFSWVGNFLTVEVQPGELVRLFRRCPGCVLCPTSVGIERRMGDPLSYATLSDPVLDTLPIHSTIPTDLSTPGSYHLRGLWLASGGNFYYYATLALRIVEVQVATGIPARDPFDLQVHQEGGVLVITGASAGEVTLHDMTGRLQLREGLAVTTGRTLLSVQDLPSGIYVVRIVSAGMIRQRKVYIHRSP
ncbi:MAG: T9SS type A sorting domain-containing protein [Flavobacteriales bacterium]|nr:T9SS type A sorting domain-containing protein [Flavobacteriales bacterium]